MLAVKSPDVYHRRSGIRHDTGKLIAPHGGNILIITGVRAWSQVNPALEDSLRAQGMRWRVEILRGACNENAIARLAHCAALCGAELILGIGGGRVLDTAKAVANRLDSAHLVTMPTIAATCAAWSPISILYDDRGGHLRSEALRRLPKSVLVDSEVIAASDARYLKAGVVDALAKWYEFIPYQRHDPTGLALNLKVQIARHVVDIVDQFGEQALRDNRRGTVSVALEQVIDACIAVAGMANSIREDQPTPGVAHAIHNRLTHEAELHHWLHGEKVGFSLLVQSLLERGEGAPDPALLALLRRYDMPLTLAPLKGERRAAIRAIAAGVRFPEAAARRLPFSLLEDELEWALNATERIAEGAPARKTAE